MLGSYAVYPLTADVLHVSHEIGLLAMAVAQAKSSKITSIFLKRRKFAAEWYIN